MIIDKNKVNQCSKNGKKEEIIWGRSIKWCKKKQKLQAYNTTINVHNLCETSSWFDFVWFVQILIDLHSKILNVKKVQIPESTTSNSIFNFIEVSDNEQLHTSILWKHKKENLHLTWLRTSLLVHPSSVDRFSENFF